MTAVGSALEASEMLFPETLDEAFAMLADPQTRGTLLAGGTDLMVQWEAGVRAAPERIIDIRSLTELKEITHHGDCLRVGAGVTHWALRTSPLVQRYVPGLAAAAATVGGRQIQAMGTIGGSLANGSPAGDIAPALLVSEATVTVGSREGFRTMPIDAFLIDYRKIDLREDELIVSFDLTVLEEGGKEAWRKLGPRAAQAISKVMGNYRGRMADGVIASFAVALGSIAPTAIRLPEVEAFVVGKPVDRKTLEEAEAMAMDFVQPISDIRSTAMYRKWVSGRLVRGFLQDLAAS